MDLFKFIIISLHIAKVFSRNSRRKYTSSSSDESIENLLYYKDCQHRRNEPLTTLPPKPPEPLRQNACPNPKMCCSMSCDNECGGNMMMARQDGSSMGMGMQSAMPMPQVQARPLRMQPQQSMMSRSRGLKRKRIQPNDMLPPIGTRRDYGFTKDKIKSLISKDGDIRAILRNLVRVTMQKVDLIDSLKTRRNGNTNGIGNGDGNQNGDENNDADEEHGDYHHHNEHNDDDNQHDDYENGDDDDDLE